ncbi:aldo/keto reductase [Microbacterium rhizomatis]|uniref:Aldo/keto reductase n=1 Tax=Microbacterium rhizomatis TaxID=1631477 RepID=A0A5J5J1X6_9MICO|nr:aldo/keto reductase [Microbacterium rhizomatis]
MTIGTSGLGRGTRAGSPDEARAVDLARAILTGPFATVDTSNAYAGGRAEGVLGLALAQLRADPAVQSAQITTAQITTARLITKVDADPVTGVLDRDRVRRSYEESLARLGMDRVELLHLHDPYTITPAEAFRDGGVVDALCELRDTGAVDAIGIAAGPIPLLREYVETGVFDALLTHNRYTLVDRSAAPLLEQARRRGMTTFNAAPFGAGILASGVRPGATYGYRPASAELVAWATRAEGVCVAHGVTLRAAALHFSLRSPLVDSTVVGVSSAGRLADLEALRTIAIPAELWTDLDALGPAPSPISDPEDAA